MSITREFQTQVTSAAITTPITSVAQLRDIIIQVVSNEGGMQFNQDRLAEILIAMLNLMSGGVILPPVNGSSNPTLSFNPNTNTLSVITGANVSASTINEVHVSFAGNIISDNSTNYQALAALENTTEINNVGLGNLQSALIALTATVAGLPTNAINGLNLISGIIRLGGLLTQPTDIDGNAL